MIMDHEICNKMLQHLFKNLLSNLEENIVKLHGKSLSNLNTKILITQVITKVCFIHEWVLKKKALKVKTKVLNKITTN